MFVSGRLKSIKGAKLSVSFIIYRAKKTYGRVEE
jgi:hypothetical protein